MALRDSTKSLVSPELVSIEVDTRTEPMSGFGNEMPTNRTSAAYSNRDSLLPSDTVLPSSNFYFKQRLCHCLESAWFQLLSLFLVIYSLFAVNIVRLANASDDVDPYIDAFLIICISVFALEIVLTAACYSRPPWFLLALDIIATATIVLDLSWVSEAAGFSTSDGNRTSDAAIVSARAARIVRLVRLLRLLRIINLLSEMAKRAMERHKVNEAKAGSGGSPSNIGGKLTDAMVIQVALVIIVTVICTALMTSWRLDPSPYDAYVSNFDAQVGASYAELQPQVDAMLAFAADHTEKIKPLTLRVGDLTWSWLDENGGYPKRDEDTMYFDMTNDRTYLEVDASEQNSHDAMLDILLVVFVLVILFIFVASVNVTIYKTLVRPLERIFNTIRSNAAQIVSAVGETLDNNEGSLEDGDLGTIEAAVIKMAKIVSHFSGTGSQGTNLARDMAHNIQADDSTKEWLATMVGEEVKSNTDAPKDAGTPTAESAKQRGSFSNNKPQGSNISMSNLRSSVVTAFSGVTSGLASFTQKGALNPGQNHNDVHHAGTDASNRSQSPVLNATRTARTSDASSSLSPGGANSRAHTGSFSMLPGIDVMVGDLGLLPPSFANLPGFGSGLTEGQKEALLAVDVLGLKSFGFDMLELSKAELTPHIVAMFLEMELAHFVPPSTAAAAAAGDGTSNSAGTAAAKPSSFVTVSKLWSFIDEVSTYYNEVPYHNIYHCADVTHTTYLLIDRLQAVGHTTPLEKFALLVAALCHDMDHPGLNNIYLINNRAPLALTYNDSAVLENSHVANLYALVANKPEIDIFTDLDPGTWKEVRKMIIGAVLHTDMTQHFPMVSKLEVFNEMHAAEIQAAHKSQRQVLRTMPSDVSAAPAEKRSWASITTSPSYPTAATSTLPNLFNTPEERQMLLNIILHCADVSNPARTTEIAEKWADRVLAEFFAQGDKERAAGHAISPMCDRNATSRSASQVNFIEFVVAPLFASVVRIFPDAGELMDNLLANRKNWHEVQLSELSTTTGKSPEEKKTEVDKAETRLNAFTTKYSDVWAIVAKRKRDHVRRVSSTVSQMGVGVGGSARPSAAGSDLGLGCYPRMTAGAHPSPSSIPSFLRPNNPSSTPGSPGGSNFSLIGGPKNRGRSTSGRMSFATVNRIMPTSRVTEDPGEVEGMEGVEEDGPASSSQRDSPVQFISIGKAG